MFSNILNLILLLVLFFLSGMTLFSYFKKKCMKISRGFGIACGNELLIIGGVTFLLTTYFAFLIFTNREK